MTASERSVRADSRPTSSPALISAPSAAMMAGDRFSESLGIEVLHAADGTATVRMTVRAEHANGHDIAHGGVLFSLADTAFACACNSFGPVTVAAAAEVVFVSSAKVDDVLVATAALRTRFGRTGIYDVTVRRADDVVAEFRGRSAQLRSVPA